MGLLADARTAYGLRWKRRRMLWRALKARHQMALVRDRTALIRPGDILCFACVRNERLRLPWFLAHHRALGVRQFLFIDNASDDGTADYLAEQPDASMWRTDGDYRASRFGMDWVNRLLARYGHGHWCLILDADEALVYPHHDSRTLADLTAWLDRRGQAALPAMLLDMYPRGPVGSAGYVEGANPFETLEWFDATGYRAGRHGTQGGRRVQGGPRERVFFPDAPDRAPTLNKLPLVRWHWRHAFVNSTHTALPPRLNAVAEVPDAVSGVLLHSKFLSLAIDKAREDSLRRVHFHDPDAFAGYYDRLIADPTLWVSGSLRFSGWEQLEELGLMSRGDWV
ncbi:MAG: glycosyltransferase family 2 protein [Paracoccaceae bacterium]